MIRFTLARISAGLRWLCGVIERGYQAEQATVALANAEPPARKAAADAQMNIILARMKLSLQSMNDEKEALFK